MKNKIICLNSCLSSPVSQKKNTVAMTTVGNL